jgi:hypothetical protein
MDAPERKSPTEAQDLQRKIEDTLAGKRPVESSYPYFPPDYRTPFVHIGTEKQLFLDNFMLDHLEAVERVFPQPERADRSVLQVGEFPWEAHHRAMPHAAFYDPDDGKFKLWYSESLTTDPYGDRGQILCYAEATDPLQWEKPLSDACLPYEGRTATNIVLEDSGHHIALVLNHDRSDPARKFLMVYNPGGRAKDLGRRVMSTALASPDGRRWKTINEDTPHRHHHVSRALWDDAIEKWIAYSQYSHHWNFLHRKRQVGRQESADFIHWSPKEVVLSVDSDPNLPPHLEFHDMSVRKVGGLYIGIATEFMAEPIWCVRNEANWRDHATTHFALYCSRDGRHWQRVGGPGPWVDNRRPGSIDAGFLCFTLAGQLVHNGRSIILHTAGADKQHWYSHPAPTPMLPPERYAEGKREWESLVRNAGMDLTRKEAVGALILREDGWAELKPVEERGKVITRQFVFEGDTLRINADARGGYARVEILDPHFQPYEGFSADDCDPVHSDDPGRVWHRVTWRGNGDVRGLWNMPCRLVIHLHHASLYGFQFVETGRS